MRILEEFVGKIEAGKFACEPAIAKEKYQKIILDKLEVTNLFVIDSRLIFPELQPINPEDLVNGEKMVLHQPIKSNPIDPDVAPPFETCWFQFPNVVAQKDGVHYIGYDSIVRNGCEFYGLFLHEISPNTYLFAIIYSRDTDKILLETRRATTFDEVAHVGVNIVDPSSKMWNFIATYLQPFKKHCTVGLEKTVTRLKYRKANGQKVQTKIKRIVHILPKNATQEEKLRVERTANVVWTHRWLVRGHWRRHPGKIGKNRGGEYTVMDWTYVIEHERGPEGAPLIKKTRVLNADSQTQGPAQPL